MTKKRKSPGTALPRMLPAGRAQHPMMREPLFTSLDPETSTTAALRAAAALDVIAHTASVTWRWTEGRGINIYTLAYKIGTGAWVDVLPHPHVDNSGAATAQLGRFPAGTVVTCGFRVLAIHDVPHMIVLASQQTPAHQEKVLPAPPPLNATKTLAAGERWEATFNYTVH